MVLLEQVAQDGAAGFGVCIEPDEQGALVGRLDRTLGQHTPDGVWLLVVGLADALEHLLLPRMIGVDGERHQLVERHAVLGIDVEQRRADRCEPQPLLDDRDGHELRRGDLLLGLALLAKRQECAELVERVKRRALDVLREAVLFGRAVLTHHARHWRGLGEAALLHQQRECPIAATAGRDLVHAGLDTFGVADRAHHNALEQRAAGNVLRQLLDRDARLNVADVGPAQQQLVERDVARRRQRDLLDRLGHGSSP